MTSRSEEKLPPMKETEKRLRAEIVRLQRENVRLFTMLHGRVPRASELRSEASTSVKVVAR